MLSWVLGYSQRWCGGCSFCWFSLIVSSFSLADLWWCAVFLSSARDWEQPQIALIQFIKCSVLLWAGNQMTQNTETFRKRWDTECSPSNDAKWNPTPDAKRGARWSHTTMAICCPLFQDAHCQPGFRHLQPFSVFIAPDFRDRTLWNHLFFEMTLSVILPWMQLPLLPMRKLPNQAMRSWKTTSGRSS